MPIRLGQMVTLSPRRLAEQPLQTTGMTGPSLPWARPQAAARARLTPSHYDASQLVPHQAAPGRSSVLTSTVSEEGPGKEERADLNSSESLRTQRGRWEAWGRTVTAANRRNDPKSMAHRSILYLRNFLTSCQCSERDSFVLSAGQWICAKMISDAGYW